VPRPQRRPVGTLLANVAKSVSRAFDLTLTDAGGSRPMWLILIALKAEPSAHQRQLAESIGIQEATLTHHLNAMESSGLLVRRRDPVNRRVHVVEPTDAGDAMFHQLRKSVAAFDKRLRTGLSEDDVGQLERLLDVLQSNVGR